VLKQPFFDRAVAALRLVAQIVAIAEPDLAWLVSVVDLIAAARDQSRRAQRQRPRRARRRRH